MKILFFSHLYPSNYEVNSGICNIQRINALRKLGYEVKIVVPVSITPPLKYLMPIPQINKIFRHIKNMRHIEKNKNMDSIDAHYLKWLSLPMRYFWSYQLSALHLSIGRKIDKFINEYRPDIVITSVLHPEGGYAKYFKTKHKLHVISIAEGSELLVYPKLYKGIEKIVENINMYCDRVIFVSKDMAEIINKKYAIANTRVINNGYDDEMFYYSHKPEKCNSTFRILSVGNLDFIKGHDLLLEAVRNIPNVVLTIVGAGDLLKQYADYINENNLTGKVFLKGFVEPSKLNKIYRESDIFCLPSRSESFGVAVLEALACGLPVVASNRGIAKEVICNGVNGFIASDLTPECLEETLSKAISQKWDNKKISESVKDYSWNRWAHEIIEISKEILNK